METFVFITMKFYWNIYKGKSSNTMFRKISLKPAIITLVYYIVFAGCHAVLLWKFESYKKGGKTTQKNKEKRTKITFWDLFCLSSSISSLSSLSTYDTFLTDLLDVLISLLSCPIVENVVLLEFFLGNCDVLLAVALWVKSSSLSCSESLADDSSSSEDIFRLLRRFAVGMDFFSLEGLFLGWTLIRTLRRWFSLKSLSLSSDMSSSSTSSSSTSSS